MLWTEKLKGLERKNTLRKEINVELAVEYYCYFALVWSDWQIFMPKRRDEHAPHAGIGPVLHNTIYNVSDAYIYMVVMNCGVYHLRNNGPNSAFQ